MGWRPQGSCETAWVTPGHDCLWSIQSMHMEQQSDHKLTTPSGMGLLVCGQGRAPLVTLVCKGECANGVNLNRFAGPRSCIRWHGDNEPLFGPQYAPKLIVSMSFDHSLEFEVPRRASSDVPVRLRWTMVTSWSWMVQRNRSMHIARCLGCKVLG